MNSQIRGVVGVITVIAGLVALSGCQPTGIVMGTTDDALTVHYGPDKQDTTYAVAPNAKITRNGNRATLEQLIPGDEVLVRTTKKDKTLVTGIDARSQDFVGEPAVQQPIQALPIAEPAVVPPVTEPAVIDPDVIETAATASPLEEDTLEPIPDSRKPPPG